MGWKGTRFWRSAPITAPKTSPGPTAARLLLPAAKAWRWKVVSRVPMIIRWPGNVPAGKVENGLISGLDWFPTFCAAAGNANVVDELAKGKKIADANYKVHLDGQNQMDLITGKGPSKRHEIFYFTEGTLGAVRIDDFKISLHGSAQRLVGRDRQSRLADSGESAPRSVRADRHVRRQDQWLARLLQLVRLRVLALCLRAAGSGEVRPNVHRLPAAAKGSQLQHGSRQGADPEGDPLSPPAIERDWA